MITFAARSSSPRAGRDEVLRQRLSAPRTLHAPHHFDVEIASTVRGLAAGTKSPTTAAS